MDLSAITREAVLSAIVECDELGRHRFLDRYGFDPARQYFLYHDGVYYDSKAIVGVAYRHVTGRPLTAGQFSGGRQTVVRLLTRLGFEVVNDEPTSPRRRLIETLETLRIASTADGPARHQPITLLWAFGKASHRHPRLVPWRNAYAELRDLMREYGQPSSRPTPEFPIIALAHTELWELRGHVGNIPAAHAKPISWLEEQDPHCGLPAWVYELIVSSESARTEAITTLGTRFFGGLLPEALLAEVGLHQGQNTSTTPSGGSHQLSTYLRLCQTVEAAEERGDHDRTSTTAREQPVRSAAATKAVLIRSGGQCENPLCTGQPNDVNKNGDPILEVDHVQDRAKWGRNHPIQMVALCPNCHVIKTRGRTGEQLREILLSEARARHTAWISRA
ncbi:HNH endonuclease signature motif containing protein [Actinomadura sp. 6K520]|uniref:HNH endonuclease signature motif containing protein n=1 Tax=Actinomadura sp. 6K520 TaxID=2530364 RepID=UPI0010447C5E|nr:HNH endonuclease signature motif containing protein [Actinomadura sp. 6K520]TDE33654.1 HNH endonuclease [Actinomadura sp. 6K520]